MSAMAIHAPEGHKPGPWSVVSTRPLIVTAMCTCGNDKCAYTVSPYDAVNTHLNPTGYVTV